MKLHITPDWLRGKLKDEDCDTSCQWCGAVAGACDNYPNCPMGKHLEQTGAEKKVKVWELMARLNTLPAGTEVRVSAYPNGTTNELTIVNDEDDTVYLLGNGLFTDDLDDAHARGAADAKDNS